MSKFFTAVCVLLSLFADAQLPHVSSGRIRRIDSFPSRFVDTRSIDIWLPDDYPKAGKYAVLYMHDGQMLFDSSITWNKQEWKVDETATFVRKTSAIVPLSL